ncbi:GH92 family glycosyl hydrolase [Terriglobus aquaticus]|uniref:GH92 family glycosyl hydrolase n=1 Tax=Terriglobus aquaticus TaxID=940139 RepID=A0ABW9KKY3_9BACT|nr:GH92 family glycosyl hydrolase [Terriglobus aquaticus]
MTLNRRTFLQLSSLAAGNTLLAQKAQRERHMPLHKAGVEGSADLTKYVNLFCGTGGHGHTYPGATVPFGAVQLSPDTGNHGWDWCSGYYTTDTSIMGFSHTHLSGTGAADLLDFLVVPRLGEVKLLPGDKNQPDTGYRTRFSHSDEHAEPGFYSVKLASGVLAELTTTERVGVHRYTFPQGGDPAHLLVDLLHGCEETEGLQNGELTPENLKQNRVGSAEVNVVGNDTVTGGRVMHVWAPTRQIYFAMVFERPFKKVQLYSDLKPVDGTSAKGRVLHAAVYPDTSGPVLVKVGISMVSAENALANVKAEVPAFDFEGVRANAKAAWNKELARIQVDSFDTQRKTIFYTAMYHMMCAPTLADDVNGQYRGMDQKVHTVDAGQHNFSTYSLWDTFRALHPSFTLWQQERVAPMVNCLVRMAEESPAGMPIWPLQGGETFCMTGYHSASVMAEACTKKVPGIDWSRAYAVMRKRNMDDDYMGLNFYRTLGYIPADKMNESVSKAVEYMYNDWACAHVAEATGHAEDAAIQRKRSQNYRNLFDPKTQFIRAKMSNGEWTPNFDPKATGHFPRGTKHAYRDYTESNAWQTTFFVQHDAKGYIETFGGRDSFNKKLDSLFVQEPGVSNEDVSDMSGYIGQYVHGNEPSHAIVFLYTYSGQPWKTQMRTRQILDTLYHNDFDGLAGNEDCGQMSAWYVMAAMGLYAVDPVSATYVLTAPVFDSTRVRQANGRELVIETKRNAPTDQYIQQVKLNGKVLDRLWVTHEELQGGHLQFTLGAEPNMTLGVDPRVAPPSLTA